MDQRARSAHPAPLQAAGMILSLEITMESMSHHQNTRPPLSGWVGGKNLLTKRIIERIPEDHLCYAEPFSGAAWVLFRKSPSKSEVLNDLNGEIVNIYRVLQYHLDEFIRYFRWALPSREGFATLLNSKPETLTDIQRAARFYYLQKSAFAGKMCGHPTFGYSSVRPPKLNLARIEEDLSGAHLRLQQVYIEHLPYHELIPRYDRQETFFYVDPPYHGCENYYGEGMFSREDFARLAELLGGIKGRFLLSLNDVKEVREIFSPFNIEEVETSYSCSVGKNKRAKEVFITNF